MNKNNHLGETRIMNCGMKATIIEYFRYSNIIVQFEDGTIIKNRTYQNFKNGNISNPNFNKRLGETRIMNYGMKCTIIEYFNATNITIRFEDGTIIKNRTYGNFKNDEIINPNLNNKNKRIGETHIMNCGMKCTIIEYFNSANITVQFEDETIVNGKTYDGFKKGTIANPNLKEDYSKRLGETRIMNCGMECTIIEYFRCDNITVQFNDGTIVKNKQYDAFKKNNILNPNLNKCINCNIGETKIMNCGMKATIIEYTNSTNITIQFEDGTIIKNKTYQNFKNGNISNPNINGANKRLGETRIMNCGMKATIIEYFRSDNITVQFENNNIIKTKTYKDFKNGNILNYNLNYFTIFKGISKEFTGTLKEIANHFNLNYANIKYRINKCNMTVEEAITTPSIKIKQNNLTYKSQKGTMKELCQKFDKNFIEVYNKVKYNHTFEWAMDSTNKPYEE